MNWIRTFSHRHGLFLAATVAVGVGLGFLALAVEAQPGTRCSRYRDSRPTYIAGHGETCAGSGIGCAECFDLEGNWCTVSSSTWGVCDPYDQCDGYPCPYSY
jgi:hypothetical protein